LAVDRQALVALLDQGLSVEAIGRESGKHPSTVAYWMAKFGLEAPLRERHAAKGGIEREELERMVEAGMSIAQMASTLGRSKTTVRHWLGRHGLKTQRAGIVGRPEKLASARAAGDANPVGACQKHGLTEFALEGRGYYRCKACRAESVVKHRRKVKETLVREAGGRCAICGYDRNTRALEFHHVDPGTKRLALSGHGIVLSLDVLRSEARKCVLLCSNCHAEVEDGATGLPLEFQAGGGQGSFGS
jgi:transposase